MEPKTILLNNWNENTDQFTSLLSKFDTASFNRKPANGGWSASDIGEHILIFDIRLNTLLQDARTPAGRDPHQQIKPIVDRLEDRENKIEAPEFLKPSGNTNDPVDIIENIRAERAKVARFIEHNDLSLLNDKTPHRFFGTLTALEWIILVIQHTIRHLPQLEALH